jgi:hypothetical protein
MRSVSAIGVSISSADAKAAAALRREGIAVLRSGICWSAVNERDRTLTVFRTPLEVEPESMMTLVLCS